MRVALATQSGGNGYLLRAFTLESGAAVQKQRWIRVWVQGIHAEAADSCRKRKVANAKHSRNTGAYLHWLAAIGPGCPGFRLQTHCLASRDLGGGMGVCPGS
jgi:hypothetical protein